MSDTTSSDVSASSAGSFTGALVLSDVVAGRPLPELAIDVTPTTVVLGAIASRDWRPMHHDYAFATQRNGVQDIFLNTPNQAAWFERYLTDWAGPRSRLGRITFRMKTSIFPGDRMVFRGIVSAVSTDDLGCGWVDLDVSLLVAATDSTAERLATTCSVRLALPTSFDDNPWTRRGESWKP